MGQCRTIPPTDLNFLNTVPIKPEEPVSLDPDSMVESIPKSCGIIKVLFADNLSGVPDMNHVLVSSMNVDLLRWETFRGSQLTFKLEGKLSWFGLDKVGYSYETYFNPNGSINYHQVFMPPPIILDRNAKEGDVFYNQSFKTEFFDKDWMFLSREPTKWVSTFKETRDNRIYLISYDVQFKDNPPIHEEHWIAEPNYGEHELRSFNPQGLVTSSWGSYRKFLFNQFDFITEKHEKDPLLFRFPGE